jgi:hypothetical protein
VLTPADGVASPHSRLRRRLPVLLPVLAFFLLACLAYWPIGPWDPHRLPVCNCADYAKMTAFLEWTPWAVLHGHNPFFSSYQDYPGGVNMALNTTMPFLGVVLAPVTLTAGPIASMNLLARIALGGSATTAFLVFRRWVRWTPAAALGGLLFGFSPYVMAHALNHPNLIFVVLLPVLLLLVDEVVVRQRMKPRDAGLLLGIVAAAQYGISSELLADGALLTAAALVLLALLHRPSVREHVPHLARSAAWSLASFVPLAGYPIVMSIVGPRHLSGPVQPLYSVNRLRSDLLGAVLPTRVQLFSFGHLGAVASGFVHRNLAENGTYVGIPLTVFVVAAAVAYRRDSRLVLMALMTAVAYFVSLGITLDVDGHATGVPLPYRVMTHLPLLDGAIAVRFFAFGYLFLALAFALGLDHLRGTLATHSQGLLGPALCGLVAVAALLPLVPRLPVPERPPSPRLVDGSYAVPTYFTDGGERAIPAGSTVLVYPYSTAGFLDYSVLWQAAGAERFRLTSGDASVPGPSGGGGYGSPPLDPPLLEQLLTAAYFGRPLPPDPLGARNLAVIRDTISDYDFSTVVVAPVGREPRWVVRAMTRVLGRRPARTGGVYVWYGVQHDLRHESLVRA